MFFVRPFGWRAETRGLLWVPWGPLGGPSGALGEGLGGCPWGSIGGAWGSMTVFHGRYLAGGNLGCLGASSRALWVHPLGYPPLGDPPKRLSGGWLGGVADATGQPKVSAELVRSCHKGCPPPRRVQRGQCIYGIAGAPTNPAISHGNCRDRSLFNRSGSVGKIE